MIKQFHVSCFRYSKPGPNIKFNDEITSVRDCAAKFTKSGINKVVALGHAGIEIDKQIAKEVDDVDVVIGGHTNTFLYSGQFPFIQVLMQGWILAPIII